MNYKIVVECYTDNIRNYLVAMRVEQWDIKKLKGWKSNPRDAEPADLQRLRGQLEKHGQYKALLVAEDGTVLGGNMRLKVMTEMGVKKVWVSVVEAPDDKTKLEYALSDNDRAGFYLRDKLTDLISVIPEMNMELYKIDLGFTVALSDIGETNLAQNVETDRSKVSDDLDTYMNSQIKQVVLYFKIEEYEQVLSRLQAVMDNESIESHTGVLTYLLQRYEDDIGD